MLQYSVEVQFTMESFKAIFGGEQFVHNVDKKQYHDFTSLSHRPGKRNLATRTGLHSWDRTWFNEIIQLQHYCCS